MVEKLKKFFSFFANFKKTAVFAVFFSLILAFLPFHLAQAGVEDLIAGAFAGVLAGVFGLVFNLIGSILGIFLGLMGLILNWVLSPDFISLSYTDPARNDFIRIGWTLIRDFTNIIFVLALIAIGLGTALRITGYQAKKALPILIIIALLVNFTPVIAGLVVDAANIVMNFFLEGVTGFDAFTSTIGALWSDWMAGWTGFWNPVGSNPAVKAAVGSLAIIFYEIIAIFVLFIYIFLFIVRYIAIWVLVILSPLAFAAYILPATRRIFLMWWNQLLQWSIIGIVLAFFLYLSNHLIELALKAGTFSRMAGGDNLAGLANQILPWGIVIILLLLGLVFGLSTSAMGANQIIRGVRKGGRAAGAFALGQTVGRFLATERGKKWMQKVRATKFGLPETREEWGKAGWRRRLAGAITAPIAYPARWGIRYGIAKPGLEYGARQEAGIERIKEEYKRRFGKDIDRAAATYPSIPLVSWREQIAMARYLSETKGAKGFKKLSGPQRREVFRKTATYTPGRLDDLTKHIPELIDDPELGPIIRRTLVPDQLSKDEKGEYKDADVKKLIELGYSGADAVRKAAFKKSVDAMKDADVDNLDIDTINNSEFQEMVLRFKPPSFIRKIGEEKGSEYVGALREQAKKLGADEIAKTNANLLRWTIKNPAFKGFFPSLPGARNLRELEASERLGKEPILSELWKGMREARRLENTIKRGGPAAEMKTAEERLRTLRNVINEKQNQIAKDKALRREWGEIKNLLKPTSKKSTK